MIGPTPVIFSSSCLSAVLTFILADCSGEEVEVGVEIEEGMGAGVNVISGDRVGLDEGV